MENSKNFMGDNWYEDNFMFVLCVGVYFIE